MNGVHYSGIVPKVQPAAAKQNTKRNTKASQSKTQERHSRESILDAALALLDERGLPDLSMRRLATVLDVQPSALYWHFADKQTLLAGLAEKILTENNAPALTQTSSWEEAMRASASTIRERLLAHRDGAELVSSSAALGLTSIPLAAMLFDPLTRAGADVETVDIAARTLGHFILGHAFHQQQHELAVAAGVGVADQADPDITFAAALDVIIAGTAVRIATTQQAE